MKKEFECCIPDGMKIRFMKNTMGKMAVNRVFDYMHLNKKFIPELTGELLDYLTIIETKDAELWREVQSMFPHLNKNSFVYKPMENKLFYYEDQEED